MHTLYHAVAIAALAALSYGYLLAALFYKSALLGADYSERLFITVQVSTAFTFVLLILALVRKSPVRSLLACTTLTISWAWFLVWAINTTV